MGQIATRTEGTELARATSGGDFKTLLTRAWPRIQKVMPRHASPERLFQLYVSTVNQTPRLAECTPYSLLSCVMKCSALGMEPSAVDGLGRAYILPYYSKKRRAFEATFILGYKGIIDLARRSGQLISIETGAVYEGEPVRLWVDDTGKHISHEPSLDGLHDASKLRGVYCRAELTGGGTVVEYMSRAEVDAIRRRSKSPDSGPWVTDYEAMARKTVLRRAAPYLPMSVEAHEAIERADETTPDYRAVLDPIIEPEPEPEPQEAPTIIEGGEDEPESDVQGGDMQAVQ